MKGDRVEIVIDAGGSTRTYEIEATRAGRRGGGGGRGGGCGAGGGCGGGDRDDAGRYPRADGAVHGGTCARTGGTPGAAAGTGRRRIGDGTAEERLRRAAMPPERL